MAAIDIVSINLLSYTRRWESTELESSLDGSYWAMRPICPFSPFLEQQGKYLLVRRAQKADGFARSWSQVSMATIGP